jgi:hypothetical protein
MTSEKSLPLPSKHVVYIILVMFLFLLLSNLALCTLLVLYPDFFICSSFQGALFQVISLPRLVFSLAGLVAGYYSGKQWWNIIYVKDIRHKKYKLDW